MSIDEPLCRLYEGPTLLSSCVPPPFVQDQIHASIPSGPLAGYEPVAENLKINEREEEE